MTWHLTKIPKVAHFYWGGKSLSWLRYLTVHSFAKHNPSWGIKVYCPKVLCDKKEWNSPEQKIETLGENFAGKLREISSICVDFENIGIPNDISENFKGDLLRWHLLSTEGGLWSDMDIVYFKSIEDAYFNVPENGAIDTVLCDQVYGNSVGFMLSQANNKYFFDVFRLAKSMITPTNYQCVGPTAINLLKCNSNFVNMRMQVIYPCNADNIDKIYASPPHECITKNTIGIHWYAGHPLSGKFANDVNESNYRDFNNLLTQSIEKALKE